MKSNKGTRVIEKPEKLHSDPLKKSLFTPKDHNMMIYYSSTTDYVSWRHPKYGSVIFAYLFYEIIKVNLGGKSCCVNCKTCLENYFFYYDRGKIFVKI